MRNAAKLFLAAAAIFAVLCSGAWAAEFVDVNGSTTTWTDGNSYIVNGPGPVLIPKRVLVKGFVTLILTDGCILQAMGGITVSKGNSLTITTPPGSKGTGMLLAIAGDYGPSAGIGGWYYDRDAGDITILGGDITARGGWVGGSRGSTPSGGAGIGGCASGGGGNITISGGKVDAEGIRGGAGIGCGYRGSGGNITITGGSVVGAVRDEHSSGSGIGGDGVNITIKGGTVNGRGRSSRPGIGYGDGNITITGGDVTATGGLMAAGIGGSAGRSGGNITITGGTVTATGGEGDDYFGRGIAGAGIGGGKEGGGGKITITGGKVNATGGGNSDVSGAGIGGGGKGDSGIITITGGDVTATGGYDSDFGGAGIGSGGKGLAINITISGGKVYASGGYKADGIGVGYKGLWGGFLSSGTNGGAWIHANYVEPHRAIFFKSGIMNSGYTFRVYGDPTLRTRPTLPRDMTLLIRQGQTLTFALNEGGWITNEGTIVNHGTIRVIHEDASATEILFLKKITGVGTIEIKGKRYNNKGYEIKAAEIKRPTSAEDVAAKRAIDRYVHTVEHASGSAMNGIKTAEDEGPADGIAEVKSGDILIDTNRDEETLCAMSVNVAAQPNGYAVIAGGQMGDVTDGDDAKGGTIVYANRFIDPNDETNTTDVIFDEYFASDEGADELDKTIVIVNGKASEVVQAMPEYVPSGLADGQGLVSCYDEETKVYVLVIFDGSDDDEDGVASAHIYAKHPAEGGGGGGCATMGAAFVAIAALAMIKRRAR